MKNEEWLMPWYSCFFFFLYQPVMRLTQGRTVIAICRYSLYSDCVLLLLLFPGTEEREVYAAV